MKHSKISERKQLYLLHSEIVIILRADRNVDSFKLLYAVPPKYEEQVPFLFRLGGDISDKISDFTIKDDRHPPNKRVQFTIDPLKKGETITVHFEYLVLIKNRVYADLPSYVKKPSSDELSRTMKKWLMPTKSIQSENLLIRITAYLMKLWTDDLIRISQRIIKYVTIHRPILQWVRLWLEINPILRPLFLRKQYNTGLSDAFSFFLLGGGLCAGQTNFAAALLRANNIPTRILIVTAFGRIFFFGEKIWVDANHVMLEFFCPGYGWVKSTPGLVGYQPKNYIISRVVYPDDEDEAGNGLSYYGGSVPFFWITNEHISLVFPEKLITSYKKPRGHVSGVPAIRLWTEKKITAHDTYADFLFELTGHVWEKFVRCGNMKLSMNGREKYQMGILAQKKAIVFFKDSNIKECIDSLKIANGKYSEILDFENEE